jgi:hypothetical protein
MMITLLIKWDDARRYCNYSSKSDVAIEQNKAESTKQRLKRKHKRASKLAALGLTTEDLKALGLGGN